MEQGSKKKKGNDVYVSGRKRIFSKRIAVSGSNGDNGPAVDSIDDLEGQSFAETAYKATRNAWELTRGCG
jgi:hypothetical protein